jgi:triacylglycerol esterase/lipase EstA (alpha/beta hydrolase family)
MVAAFLWIGFALEIAIYAAIVTLLQHQGWQPGPAVTLCIALAISWRTGFVLTTFRLARVAPRPGWALAETAAFSAACVLMMCAPAMPRVTRGSADRVPVLLVHGWNCNSGIWWPLRRLLRATRVGDVHTLDLPTWQGLDVHVESVRRKVEEILANGRHERIAIVGHSMGGVIGRFYLDTDSGRERIARLITIGSPHHGTTLGLRALDPAGRELGTTSGRFSNLPNLPSGTPVTALYSEIDNFIAPQSSAMLEGAENLCCGDLGHLQLLFAAPVLEAVALRLEHTR